MRIRSYQYTSLPTQNQINYFEQKQKTFACPCVSPDKGSTTSIVQLSLCRDKIDNLDVISIPKRFLLFDITHIGVRFVLLFLRYRPFAMFRVIGG